MGTLSKKHPSFAGRRRKNVREALASSVLAAGPPLRWDVETESWTRDELDVLTEDLIPGEGIEHVDASRAVLAGLIQYRLQRTGTWSWPWLVAALRRAPEIVFAEAAAGSARAEEYVGGLLAVPFGVRSRKTMRVMSGLVSASCKVGRYLQKIQASGDLK